MLLSIQISPVKSKDFLVSLSEVTSELPAVESAWKTCARKTGIGSVERKAVSVREVDREWSYWWLGSVGSGRRPSGHQ